MSTKESLPALLLKINEMRTSLTKAEQLVVDYISQNPAEVIRLSVAELAENSGVSDATVVRTCRRLGMQGYQDLKLTLAKDIVTPLQSIHEEIREGDNLSTIVEKVFQGNMHALEFTYNTLSIESIEKVTDAIINANKIIIIGLGNSHSIAMDFQHKLMRLGLSPIALTDSHLQAIAMANLVKNDVVFAISHSGSSIDIVNSVKLAKEYGATTISLTNINRSPLSKITDIQLYTAAKETQYRIVALSSRIAQMSIIDSIYTCIASKSVNAEVEIFGRIEKALSTKKF